MSILSENISKYINASLGNLANGNFSTYAMSLLSDAASALVGRSVGSSSSYNTFLSYVSSLGHTPKNVFSKSYPYIYSNMTGNNARADELSEGRFNFPKFTFYRSKPDIVLSDPENDLKEYFGDFIPEISFSSDMRHGYELKYSERNEDAGLSIATNVNEDNGKTIESFLAHGGDAHGGVGSFNSVPSSLGKNDLITKTNELFNRGTMQTLIARFHTNAEQSKDENNQLQTAISTQYGMSHGRNLLSGNDPSVNGYDNPYCRTWTYHHQYKDYARAMRPFVNGNDDSTDELTTLSQKELKDKYQWSAFGNNLDDGENADTFGGLGRARLDKLGVLNNTGRPNIVPIYQDKDANNDLLSETNKIVDVKNCMFSIENLAWKVHGRQSKWFDINGLSDEQKGPMGGRIMWFPPYNLSFNESITPEWNSTDFIGRGESIYTYKNTKRTGNLSFTMLIDHPAILDYWEGWQKNGQRNNGTTLADLNTGGVDNPNNQEQTLLRFFAGCDVLTATPRKCKVRGKKKVKPKEKSNSDPDTPAEPNTKKLIFFVYFPNNYSGKDDISDPTFFAKYLLNGIGTQKGAPVNDKGKITSLKAQDVSIADELQPLYLSGKSYAAIGGYEMRSLSVDLNAKTQSATNFENYSNFITLEGEKAYDDSTSAITEDAICFRYGSTGQFYLAKKIVGENAHTQQDKKKDEYHYLCRWYYRIDSSTQNQQFNQRQANYIDQKSFQLNSLGYTKVNTYLAKELQDTGTTDIISYTDAYIALNSDKQGALQDTLSGLYNEQNIKLLQNILNGDIGIKVKSCNVYGQASANGKKQVYNAKTEKTEAVTSTDMLRNNTLANSRAASVAAWINKVNVKLNAQTINNNKTTLTNEDNKAVYNTSILQDFGQVEDTPNVDNEKEKIYRSAAVVIEYTTGNVTDADKTNSATQTTKDLTGNNPNMVKVTNKTQLAMLAAMDEGTRKELESMSLSDAFEMETDATDTQKSALEQEAKKTITNPSSNSTEDEYDTIEETMPRYDNEGEFFKQLQLHDPNAMSLISKKVQYFDPAFHSISPEGFAARLTFLQQCTRQGNTVSASDTQSKTANNLSFGAPPVCVLRIGDFYYTRILITSINIKYDKPTWDLNPEGVGVMPMMADIYIGFTFIGGSDLGGPISRLQNAVSFNYYANTSVYDNRAEQVKYGENGEMTHFKPFEVKQSSSDDVEEDNTTTK